MQLEQDDILKAVGIVLAEGARESDKGLAEIREQIANLWEHAKAEADVRLVLREDEIAAEVIEKLREARLDLDEKLFAATKRFDRLSAALEERLAEMKDGEPGPPGADGEPGPEGAPGRDGIDGRDGITGEARGKYDPAEAYGKFDRVSFNGSEWIARQDDPGPLPGDGWMLGAQGKRGRPGVGIQTVSVKNYTVVLELDNGKTIPVDLRGMFERYHEERGE